MALDTITQARLTVQVAWNVSKTRSGFEPVNNTQTLSHVQSFTLGTGAGQINDLVAYIDTITANTTEDIDLSAALTNVVNDLAITAARVKFYFFKLLSASDLDQLGNVIGNACSGVSLGGDANSWPFLANVSDIIRINNGDWICGTRKDATGLAITGGTGDVLQVQNHDASVDAKLLVVLGIANA